MKAAIISLLLVPVFATAKSPSSLEFLQASNPTAQDVIPLTNGSVIVTGYTTVTGTNCSAVVLGSCDQVQVPMFYVLGSMGDQEPLPLSLGHGNGRIAAAAVDASGNIWITGETDSDDFPLVNPLIGQKTPYEAIGFVMKLSPGLTPLFSTFLGTQETVPQGSAVTTPVNIALDASGNAFVTGWTGESAFPTTGPVFGTGAPSAVQLGVKYYTFVTKFSADGTKMVFSRLLGGDQPLCGGDSCLGFIISNSPSAIAVDASGNVTVAGATNVQNFPVTANAYQSTGGAFVSRISADGSQLIWSTEIGVYYPLPGNLNGVSPTGSTVSSIALDASGDVYVAGSAQAGIPTTPGALQSTVSAPSLNGFLAELNSGGTNVVFATNLGGSDGATLAGLTLDSSGNIWVAGNTTSPNFPGLSGTPVSGLDFVLELNAAGTTTQQTFALVPGTVTHPPSFDSNGNLLLLASAGSLMRLNPATFYSSPAVLAITNAAVPHATVGLAPGEIVAMYGVGLGPSTGIMATPGANGMYPTQLGGVSVQFTRGTTAFAPLLYVGPDQINFQVPFEAQDLQNMVVTTPSGPLPSMYIPEVGSLGIFGVLNPDGTVNGFTNPAPAGSIVSLYLTGLGLPYDGASDGALAPSTGYAFSSDIQITTSVNPMPLSIDYAGLAPGYINGLDQINLALPGPGAANPTLIVQRPLASNGNPPATANTVTVYTH